MSVFDFVTQHGTLLDTLALAASLLILLFLTINRRRYGALVLSVKQNKEATHFADEITRQLIFQQSQKAYDNLQQSLTREFETFRQMGNGDWSTIEPSPLAPPDLSSDQGGGSPGRQGRRQRYRKAEEMLTQGADRRYVMQQCGLAESEMALLQGLHQFEQGRRA